MKFVVDDALDSNGYFTIRPDDGSLHGDTDAQPIATVYSEEHVDLLAAAPRLLAALEALLTAKKGQMPWDEARAAIREAKGG